MIMPIFFDVDPDEVKLKSGLYLEALQKHEEKFGSDVLQRWKDALKEVARIKGWDLKDRGYLPDHLVGIRDSFEEVMRLLDEGSPDIRYLVIHGMGGIGKTTLAKVVFNHISSRFHGCSFLFYVQEASKGREVVQLQRQLLSELLNIKGMEISDYDAGIYQIKRRFRKKKVVLVLDNLNKWDQLTKLAEKPEWFGRGSRIIITTRDINFLPIKEENQENNVKTHLEEFKIFQMRELCHRHALQLFSKHAFRMDSPSHDYYHISCDIIHKTGGLPLAIVVIGSSLYGKSKSLWKATLKKLDLVPNQDVHHKLKISFEMLEDAQKEIFLDIACYFIGEEKIFPHYMWKAMDISPKVEIFVLSHMSLIKVDKNDRLSMHDLLKDLGREIVREEDKILEKRSRLWSPKVALDILQNRKGTKNITALKLTGLPKVRDFTSEEFSWLPNLRLLELEGANLTGDFKNLLSSLKWQSWCHCPSDLQVINLCLGNLVVLKLLDSEIPENWNGWGPCLENCDLKVMHLVRCHLSIAPNISTCLNLRILVFAEHCPELPQIDNSIDKLQRLKHLEITAARVQPSRLFGSPRFDLCVVPSAICRLKNLSKLKLEGQCTRELHASIGEMAGLKCLSLKHCYRLGKLLDSIGKLRSLLELDLFNTRIKELPDSIVDLKRLEKMCLGRTRIRELPNSIARLESLLYLDLQHTKITTLPASVGYLKKLRCLNMVSSKMRELPNSIGDLKMLEHIVLDSTQIRELSNSIGGLESLIYLELQETNIKELLASIGYLKRLKRLDTARCLHFLEFNGIKSPIEQPLFSELRCLSKLRLSRCELRDIDFKWLENLHCLDVRGCKSLEMELLEELSIKKCSSLGKLADLSKLHKLRSLLVSDCKSLRGLPDLPNSLENLSIVNWSIIRKLPDQSKLLKLQRLYIGHCKSLQDLPDLPNACHLDVHACPRLGESRGVLASCWRCRKSNPRLLSRWRPPFYG
ncbi:hypothetical protein BT93_L1414 [Corymbia citriodora subsp. variegata]|uniref:TMV resistance protein N-like n=1 Tax=Corymbia citriodora subsp. variegata TaxID=360336 RepID=A0A8T0CMP3_CORYI|nr:hypothetical protein BT93_L1414 [Corymbia citriodora subsp. variegata]